MTNNLLKQLWSLQQTLITNRARGDAPAGATRNGGSGYTLRPCTSGWSVRAGRPRGREGLRETVTVAAGDQGRAVTERAAIHDEAPERGEHAEKHTEPVGRLSRGPGTLGLLLYILGAATVLHPFRFGHSPPVSSALLHTIAASNLPIYIFYIYALVELRRGRAVDEAK